MGRKAKKGVQAKERVEQARKAILAYARGTARTNTGELQRDPPPISLSVLKIISHEELERKYGDIR